MMLSNHFTLHHPPLLLSSIFPSIRNFSNVWALHIKWPKYGSFSFSNSPSKEYSGLISFRIELFGFLSVQGTLKCPITHNLNVSILRHSAFLVVQLLPLYTTTGKQIYRPLLAEWCLFFNTLSKEKASFSFVTIVTAHSDFGVQENKICHYFQYFPYYLPWSDGPKCHDLSFLNVEFQSSFFTALVQHHQEAL